MDEELAFKASFLEKQANELGEHIEKLTNQILELNEFTSNLAFLAKSTETISLSSLGKGVYMKTLLQDRDLFVNVGSGVIVKKSIGETQKIIEQQIKNLTEARIQLTAQMELYNHALKQTLNELQSETKAKTQEAGNTSGDHSHQHKH